VGYAARQISSGAQLERLLSNPPSVCALQMVAITQVPPEVASDQACGACQQQLKVGWVLGLGAASWCCEDVQL
jgi:hypothetical protein